MINSALEYGAQGWRVFPVEPKGKKPLIKDWPNAATKEQSQIRAWWAKWPDANIGLSCGKKSGVFVIDVDTANNKKGEESLAILKDVPSTRESRTGSGGRHLFFAYPHGREVRNKQPIDPKLYPDLDVRGEGGYVVLPPSIHETGNTYEWINNNEFAECPVPILDIIAPKKRASMPWERPEGYEKPKPKPVQAPVEPVDNTVKRRASLYLWEVPAAVQGSGGHNALLWAARCLVVGFELSDADALDLLWSEYNPRCSPPWDRNVQADVNDFERKVSQARTLPFDRKSGWLLENDMLNNQDALASMLGNEFAKTYTERVYMHAAEDPDNIPDISDSLKSPDFPLHCFPPRVREYIELVSDVQVVGTAGVALSILISAGSAMGNAFRLKLKGGFEVPPILWGAIISSSGSNKSGPFREIVKPLRLDVPRDRLEHRMRNPQGQLLIEDATTEAVLGVLDGSPRGLIMANGEGAGWVGAFDRYSQGSKKKVSVDETVWLKMWDCDTYQKNRKTDSENMLIHNASCGVLVCIQPKKMAECFDPSQFASGLVPRLLVVYLPKKYRGWSEREMTDDDSLWWKDTIMKLRSIPFAAQDPNTGEFFPNIVVPSVSAKNQYIKEFNRVAKEIASADEMTELFLGKAQGMTGRVALVLHGLGYTCGLNEVSDELSEQTMLNGIEIMQYLVDQQMSVYNLAGESYAKKSIKETMARVKAAGGKLTARELQRKNGKKYPNVAQAAKDLERLAEGGFGDWDPIHKVFTMKGK